MRVSGIVWWRLVTLSVTTHAGKQRGSLRHSVSQAERAGVSFEMLEQPLSEVLWQELQVISDAWLDSKHIAVLIGGGYRRLIRDR